MKELVNLTGVLRESCGLIGCPRLYDKRRVRPVEVRSLARSTEEGIFTGQLRQRAVALAEFLRYNGLPALEVAATILPERRHGLAVYRRQRNAPVLSQGEP